MARKTQVAVVALAALLTGVAGIWAAVPLGTAFTYQGRLTLDDSTINNTCDFEISLWDDDNDPTPGNMIGDVIPATTDVVDGLFTVELDFGADVFDGDARWLEIAVACPAGGRTTILSPRQPITATPYALYALDGPGGAGGFWAAAGADIYNTNAGNVGIGVMVPEDAKLHVETSVVSNPELGGGAVILGHNTGTTGFNAAVEGRNDSAAGVGVHGHATSTSGPNVGVSGETDSPAGMGVLGRANHADGYAGYFQGGRSYFQGRVGIGTDAAPETKLQVEADIDAGGLLGGAVILGRNTSTSGIDSAVMGATDSTEGRGVSGLALATSGENYGVAGYTASPDGYAGCFTGADGSGSYFERHVGIGTTPTGETMLHVEGDIQAGGFVGGAVIAGRNTATTGIDSAILGSTDSSEGRGVAGIANATSGENIGVGGHTASPDGFAGYFTGPQGSGSYFQRHVGIGTTPTDETMLLVEADIQAGSLYGGAATVLGRNTAATGRAYGVFGESQSSGGWAVVGLSTSTTGSTAGVYGETFSPDSAALFGWANAGTGVVGRTDNADGRGVSGFASSNTGTNYGVYAETDSPDGYAGYFTGGRNYFQGNVGIGSTTPDAKLDVVSQTANAGNNTAEFRALNIGPNRSHIHFGTTGDWYIRSASPQGKVVLQDTFGYVGIGTDNPMAKLDVEGGVVARQNLVVEGGIYADGNIYTDGVVVASCGTLSCSDARYKKDVEPIADALATVSRLRGVHFDWKRGAFPDRRFPEDRQIGLIAQEVRKVLPEVVHEDSDGYLSLDYGRLTPLLVEASKELNRSVEQRDAQLARQEKKIEELTARLERMEELLAVTALAKEDAKWRACVIPSNHGSTGPGDLPGVRHRGDGLPSEVLPGDASGLANLPVSECEEREWVRCPLRRR